MQSNIPDHCKAYALSDPKDKDYQMTSSHDHLKICDRCELLASVLADIHHEKMSDSNVSHYEGQPINIGITTVQCFTAKVS